MTFKPQSWCTNLYEEASCFSTTCCAPRFFGFEESLVHMFSLKTRGFQRYSNTPILVHRFIWRNTLLFKHNFVHQAFGFEAETIHLTDNLFCPQHWPEHYICWPKDIRRSLPPLAPPHPYTQRDTPDNSRIPNGLCLWPAAEDNINGAMMTTRWLRGRDKDDNDDSTEHMKTYV